MDSSDLGHTPHQNYLKTAVPAQLGRSGFNIGGMSTLAPPIGSTCPECNQPLHGNAPFCPYCGASVLTKLQRDQVDGYVRTRVGKEVTERLVEEDRLVATLGDKVEDLVWKRIWRYAGLVSLWLLTLTWLGFSSFKDIAGSAKKRLDPIVTDAEKRATQAEADIQKTADEVAATRKQIDQLSKDATAQQKRLDQQTGEAKQKLDSLQASADRAEKLGADYDTRVDAAVRRLDTQSARVDKAVNNLAVVAAYPSIDAEPYAMISGQPFEKSGKKVGDVWVQFYISPWGMQQHLLTGDQVKTLFSELTQAGFTPFPGTAALGGRVGRGFGVIGHQSDYESNVIYYDPSFEAKAEHLYRIAAKYVKFSSAGPILEKFRTLPNGTEDPYKVFVDKSGFDAQVIVSSIPQ
jgi:hypothetical protein